MNTRAKTSPGHYREEAAATAAELLKRLVALDGRKGRASELRVEAEKEEGAAKRLFGDAAAQLAR
jgi:hypothetical protein